MAIRKTVVKGKGLITARSSAAGILALCVLTGCHKSSSSTSDLKTQDQLVMAWETPVRTIDPRYASDADSQYLENLVHCALVSFDAEGKTVGDLAVSWHWDSPLVLTVALKPGATFNDGTPVTADDVKATYDFFKRPNSAHPSPRAGAFSKIAAIEAKDPHTVVFKLSDPDASFASNLVVGILPKVLTQGDMLPNAAPLKSCGPFTLASIGIDGIELERNPHYGLGSAPRLKHIAIKVVRDETTRYAKLQKGEVDLVENLLSPDTVDEIAKNHPDLKIEQRAALSTTYLGFNMKHPILSKPLVRQAISYAIDRHKIITYILKGMATPATTLLPANNPYYDQNLPPVSYDPEKAKSLLDAAGFKQSSPATPRFTLTYKTTTNLMRINIAKAIASQLKQVGIDVQVQSLEWGKFKADIDKGQVDLWSLSWIGFKDPDIYRYAFATESFPPAGGNRGWYSNPELDKLLAAARITTDETQRKAYYVKAQEIVARDMPYVFLWHEANVAVLNPHVENFSVYADGRYAALKDAYKR